MSRRKLVVRCVRGVRVRRFLTWPSQVRLSQPRGDLEACDGDVKSFVVWPGRIILGRPSDVLEGYNGRMGNFLTWPR